MLPLSPLLLPGEFGQPCLASTGARLSESCGLLLPFTHCGAIIADRLYECKGFLQCNRGACGVGVGVRRRRRRLQDALWPLTRTACML
jgi:hypothetical protein